jgi:hypothetical protein
VQYVAAYPASVRGEGNRTARITTRSLPSAMAEARAARPGTLAARPERAPATSRLTRPLPLRREQRTAKKEQRMP